MNKYWETILEKLTLIKLSTHAQWVSFETAPYGMKIKVDWYDNTHCIFALGQEEIKSANYEIIDTLVEYFNAEHEKAKITK